MQITRLIGSDHGGETNNSRRSESVWKAVYGVNMNHYPRIYGLLTKTGAFPPLPFKSEKSQSPSYFFFFFFIFAYKE